MTTVSSVAGLTGDITAVQLSGALDLGTMATQNSSGVMITGGSISASTITSTGNLTVNGKLTALGAVTGSTTNVATAGLTVGLNYSGLDGEIDLFLGTNNTAAGGGGLAIFQLDANTNTIANSGSAALVLSPSGDLTPLNQLLMSKSASSTPELGSANLNLSLMNDNVTYTGVAANVLVTAISETPANGFIYNINSVLESSATNSSNQEVAVAASALKFGSAKTWSYFGQNSEVSGLCPTSSPTSSGALIGYEQDLSANGAEQISTVYSPGLGGRVGLHMAFGSQTQHFNTWTAGASFSNINGPVGMGLNASSVVLPTHSTGFVYVCTETGTTGLTEPVWPTTINGTVTDGTTAWICSCTVNAQFSRAIDIGTSTGAELGAGLFTSGTYYDAIIEASQATLDASYPSAAAIRLKHDMPIDFSANGLLSGQNLSTLQYNSSLPGMQYTKNTNSGGTLTSVFTVSIKDTGAAEFVSPKNVTVSLNDFESGGQFVPLIISGNNTSQNSPIAIDLYGYSCSTPNQQTIRLSATTSNNQGIGWFYSGSLATISVTWPNFIFSNGIQANGPIAPGAYLNTALPNASAQALGAMAFCKNGRNPGEGAGSGTGCPVFVKGVSETNTWCAIWSGVAVTV